MTTLSSSGARVRGDDYQHTYALTRAIEVVLAGSNIVELGVEDPDPEVHNADDVTIYRSGADNEFVQAKSSVDAQTPATLEWLTEPSRADGPSILTHLFHAWKSLTSRGEHPRLRLVSNKLIDPNDPVLGLREGTDGTVVRQLRAAKSSGRIGKARAHLAEHLGTTEGELISFLERLSFGFGVLLDDLRSDASFRMAAAGLRSDRHAIDLAVGLIRGWVTTARRTLTADEIRQEFRSLGIEITEPVATVVIQAIDRFPTVDATTSLDWVDRFIGDEARNRRTLRDPKEWNAVLRPELLDAARVVKSAGLRQVHISGAMRVPMWFAAGSAFGETAGFSVEAFQNGELWRSTGSTTAFQVEVQTQTIGGDGAELAIVVSISTDISTEVREAIAERSSIGILAVIRPRGGPGRAVVVNPDQARGLAVVIRDTARDLALSHRPTLIHLYLAMPAAAAMLLGHLWDRIGNTQLYVDMAPGYSQAYLIPN